mmetsp:Transcript_12973/g.34382  ORF Transcript_12973/g.34382 Transcript_12973/m.34382 type:complete len:255 (-) Transcript_12973:39-803(-)
MQPAAPARATAGSDGDELPQTAAGHLVLFMHPMGGPRSGSFSWLERRYGEGLRCPDMSVGIVRPDKRNSIGRRLIANAFSAPPWRLLALALHDSLDGCVAVQLQELEAASVRLDLVVAESWGAIVALLLLSQGRWRGPTLLISPALSHASHACGVHAPERAPEAVAAEIARRLTAEERRRMLIVHGLEDRMCPIEDVRALSRTAGIELVELAGTDHFMRDPRGACAIDAQQGGGRPSLLGQWVDRLTCGAGAAG